MSVRDRILELASEGRTAGEVAARVGSAAQYVRRVAREAGLPLARTRPGPPRDDELVVLSSWHAAVGRWLGRAFREEILIDDLAKEAGISTQRLRLAETGSVDLTMSELLRLSTALGEPVPPMVTTRPRMVVPV